MPRRFRIKQVAVLGAVAVTGGAFVAAVGSQSPPQAPHDLQAAIENEPLVKVLDFPSAAGAGERAMFVQPTSAGFICVWDAPSASSKQLRQGGCNPSDDPLGGRALSASLAYEGGPAIDGVKDARLIGLASVDAVAVRVLMSDGSSRPIRLKKTKVGSAEYQAFGYRFKTADLKKGIGPTAVVALDLDGVEIGRQPTGIGG